MKVKKYEGGVKGIFKKQKAKEELAATELSKIDSEDAASMSTQPKKMNFFQRLKTKENESAAMAESIDKEDFLNPAPKKVGFIDKQRAKEKANHSILEAIDAEDAREAEAKKSTNKPSYNITQESSFVGPKQTRLDATIAAKSKTAGLDSIKEVKTKTAHNNGSTEAVRQWQRKRGLVADGIWGNTSGPNKSKTQLAYEKEQAAKKSTPKKMSLTKVTDSSTKPVSFDSPKQIGEGLPTVKGKVSGTVTTNKNTSGISDSQRKAAYKAEVGSGESGAAVKGKSAEEMYKINTKGDKEALNVARTVGIGGAGLTALSVVLGTKKGKAASKSIGKTVSNLGRKVSSSNSTGKAVSEGIGEFAEEISGKSRKMAVGKNAPKTETPKATNTPKHDSSPEAQARRAREAQVKQANERAANANKNSMKPRGEYMSEEQRAKFKNSLHANVPKQEVKAPTAPTTKTFASVESKGVKSKGFESKVSGDKFKKDKKK